MPLQAPSADFRALQVLQDADRATFFARRTANALDVAGVIFVRAVGEIQAGHIHAQPKQVAQDSFGVRGRADGGNDFRAPDVGRPAFRAQIERGAAFRFALQIGNLARHQIELSRLQSFVLQ